MEKTPSSNRVSQMRTEWVSLFHIMKDSGIKTITELKVNEDE